MAKIKYRTIAIYDADHAAIKKLAEDNARSIPRQLSFMIRNWEKLLLKAEDNFERGPINFIEEKLRQEREENDEKLDEYYGKG